MRIFLYYRIRLGVFDELVENNLLRIPELRRLEEVGKADDPKYCPYHHLISHSIEDCFILKLDSWIISLPLTQSKYWRVRSQQKKSHLRK